MGAVLWIPVLLIALLAIGGVLWALFGAGLGATAAAKSAKGETTGETAAHTDERTKSRHVDTTPPDQTG
ncbi:hypothetical protein [Kribbella sp. NPDC051770]|uniref:hypothetical protein n=1 Tax=Kribbella sp. NPDC051770 TaxID=3155413 RepID=UPI00341589BA